MTKQDYYETLVRNRYYLWAYTGNVCTMDNLDEVKEGRLYVPLYDEVHLEPCPRPPLKIHRVSGDPHRAGYPGAEAAQGAPAGAGPGSEQWPRT